MHETSLHATQRTHVILLTGACYSKLFRSIIHIAVDGCIYRVSTIFKKYEKVIKV